MTPILPVVIALLLYPGILFSFALAILCGCIRSAMHRINSGQWGSGPIMHLRALTRRLAQASTIPVGLTYPLLQLLPLCALTCPILVLAFLPLPGNLGTGSIPYSMPVFALIILLFGMPLFRILLGWAIPSPYSMLAATRSTRKLIAVLISLFLAVVVPLAISGSQGIVETQTMQSVFHQSSSQLFIVCARILAGIAYLATLPALTMHTAFSEGSGAIELVAGELTELSGRELLLMQASEWLQTGAAIAVGIVLFVFPFVQSDLMRGVVGLAGACLIAAGLGWWDALAPRIRTKEDEGVAPLGLWIGFPTAIGVLALLCVVLAQRIG